MNLEKIYYGTDFLLYEYIRSYFLHPGNASWEV